MTWVRAWVCLVVWVVCFSASGSDTCGETLAREQSQRTFGFEVEYVPGENLNLWNWYRPEKVSESKWLSWPLRLRDQYTQKHADVLAPELRVASKLIRLPQAPSFIPEALIRDDTMNWEIVGPVFPDYQTLEENTQLVDANIGAGSYQAHIVAPIDTLERGVAGYSLFSADLLTFRKLHSQLKRWKQNPKSTPGAFFIHPYLSVFTDIKKSMLLKVIEANLNGNSWHNVIPYFSENYPQLAEVLAEESPWYKYTLANTYRSDIYGNTKNKLLRWGFEVRSAHKNLNALLTEIRTLGKIMDVGFESFERFESLEVVQAGQFDRVFSKTVQKLLLENIPLREDEEEQKPYYFTFLHRPLEQYASLLALDPVTAQALKFNIIQARTRAVEQLELLAHHYASKTLPNTEARKEIMLVLARFADETGLLEHLEQYQTQVIEGEKGMMKLG